MKAIAPMVIVILGIMVVTGFLAMTIPLLTMRIHISIILNEIYDYNTMDLLVLSLVSSKYDEHSYYKYLSEGDAQVTTTFLQKLSILQKNFGLEGKYTNFYVFIPYERKSENLGKLVRVLNIGG
jgi:hypothetical protein